MAQVIVEEREFKDRDTNIVTKYMYFAIKGGKPGKEYEVPLKQLTGAEKTALQMIADIEEVSGVVTSRKATESEQEDFFKNRNEDDSNIDLDE